MDRDPHPEDPNSLPQTYGTLVNLWTSGVRDYHSLLSDYLTANSIFVAAIGFILARQPPTFLFTFLGMILCVFGVLMVLQMAIVLGRFSAQIALWEWQLRGSELYTSWTQPQLFIRLQQYRDHHQALEDHQNDPPVLHPTWALRQHRQWWARREFSFPIFFGIAYVLFLVWRCGYRSRQSPDSTRPGSQRIRLWSRPTSSLNTTG